MNTVCTFSICLLGDFNAANLPDSVQDDAFENQEFVPPQGSNQDNAVNKYGHKLLNILTPRCVYCERSMW